jgi:uncharacterized membrane protein
MEKLKSRKLWVAVLVSFLLVMRDGLGIDVDVDGATTAAVAIVGAAYLIGQGIADAFKQEE